MKRTAIILISIVLLSALPSCNKFLDTLPDNRTELNTKEKIQKLLVSAYSTRTYVRFFEYASDNVELFNHSNNNTNTLIEQNYAWEPITEASNESNVNTWQGYYQMIATANAALEAIEKMGTPDEVLPYKGEALLCRAYAHLCLTMIYCLPYHPEYASEYLGVTYMDKPETTLNPRYTRGTLQEDYEKIGRDIEAALPLIDDEAYSVPKYHFNKKAAYALATRFYIYSNQWQKAVDAATQVLGSNPSDMLRDWSAASKLSWDYSARALDYVDPGNKFNLLLMTREGSYEGMPQSRDFKVKVMDSLLPESVSVNGETVLVRYLEKDFAFVIDVPQNDCATEKVIRIIYADDSPFIADGTVGVARRMANAIEAMKYRYGCDPIDDLAAMTSLNVAVHYSPEKAEEIIGAFKARYRNLPEIISRQHWLSAPDWEWFLNYCAWDKEYAGSQEDKKMSGNPLFPGWYSDPEAVIWDDEYWVFPTASLPFEQQTYMDAFSSPDLVHWTRHESIVDTVKVKWIWQAMWSPAVIEKDGYYYLFICGNDMYADGDGGIGYVRADNPAGPYEDILGKPLLDKIINGAQPIDQYIFKDKDGTYYMYYGGWGHCNVCILNDDFTGFVPFEDGETFKEITPDGYYEGPFMFIKDGKYYFMWSEGTWTRDDYRVAYAIADNPLGPFERVGIILQQDLEVGTGAGHHSMLHEPESDKWYIFYHRHPLGSTDGNNRVVCVDEIHFDENGYIIPVKMTYEGVQSNPLK